MLHECLLARDAASCDVHPTATVLIFIDDGALNVASRQMGMREKLSMTYTDAPTAVDGIGLVVAKYAHCRLPYLSGYD